MGRYDDALGDLDHVIQHNPPRPGPLDTAVRPTGPWDTTTKRNELDRAIEFDPGLERQ